MRYRIRRTDGLPEDLKALGYCTELVLECGAVHLPTAEEIEQGGAVAHFNGFEIELKPGDEVKAIED